MSRLASVSVVVVLVLVALTVSCKGEDPSGKAVGSIPRNPDAVQVQNQLWEALAQYQGTFLASKKEALQARPDDPVALLGVLDTLMYEVTGPSGVWRGLVPKDYFGCGVHYDTALCQQFQHLEMSFFPWESLHVQVSTVKGVAEADAFLVQFGPKVNEYLKYYVPRSRTLADVQATPFFKSQLAMFIDK
jgi:hypothetical protein